jgi:hypothetical protein
VGLKLLNITQEQRRSLLLHLFTEPTRWQKAHHSRVQTNFGMGLEFYKGILKIFRSFVPFIIEIVRSAFERRADIRASFKAKIQSLGPKKRTDDENDDERKAL